MTQTLGLSDREIKITITEYDRVVMEKVLIDNKQDRWVIYRERLKTLKYQKETLGIRNMFTEIKNVFYDRLISRFKMALERICELEVMSVDTSQLKCKEKRG